MIHPVSLALFSLLLFLGSGDQSLSAQERQDALRLGPVELRGDGPSYAEVGLGGFNVLDMDDGGASAAGQIQLRWGRKLYFVGPAIGLMGNTDGGGFGYGGVYADIAVGDVVFTPLLGAGGYAEGDSSDLGGVFQFRTALGITHEFDDGTRFGVRVAHISNAGIHDDNPGEEELYLTFALPFP